MTVSIWAINKTGSTDTGQRGPNVEHCIQFDVQPKRLQAPHEFPGDCLLFVRGTIDAHQIKKRIQHSIFLDHADLP